jgi:hypothetical protein
MKHYNAGKNNPRYIDGRTDNRIRGKKYYQRHRKKFYLYNKQWRKRNKIKIKEMSRKYYIKNKKKIQQKAKLYYIKNKEYLDRKSIKWRFKNLYGITISEKNHRYREQHGKCLICNQKYSKLEVDHNHNTKKTRGLLCFKCNRGLGCFNENIKILLSAILYLKKNK